jgi:hydroxymethylpyrimidine/phosphomethylpyrimidine kinase
VLAFAGADPTGGAGLQADALTLAALGCHPVSVVTAITAQDTTGVAGVQPVAADWVARQARTVLADVPVQAVKIGMVATPENAVAIAAVLDEHPGVPVVLDPVLASGRGDPLGTGDMAAALAERLVPRATVVTPNSLEARRLAAGPGEADAGALPLERCAARLAARGAKFVLVTGTHEPTDEVVNALYDARGLVRSDRWERLPGAYHGSGCTLAAAIAAGLAHGLAVPEAVQAAEGFTWQALADGFRPGGGQSIPDRLFRLRRAAAQAADQ